MGYATVSTKKSSLKVYNITNSSDKNMIGTIPSGSKVETIDHRIVNNVEWLKVKTENISGWVISKHPSVSYSFLEMDTSTFALNYTDGSIGAAIGSYLIKSIGETKNAMDTIAPNAGTIEETDGIVSNVIEETKSPTFKLTAGKSDAIENLTTTGYRIYNSRDRDPAHDLPENIQNIKGYPTLDKFDSSSERYVYDYSTNYNEFTDAINDLHKSINLIQESTTQLYDRYSRYYNRFKVASVDDVLTKTFAHVFFTRPDCNIIQSVGSESITLVDQLSKNPDYEIEFKNNPGVLLQLSQAVGLNHQFMMLPSNRVNSFECRDRNIDTVKYGKTFHGHNIAYGRQLDESLSANEVSITFTDDRDLRLLKLHQLWVQYISDVNKGRLRPSHIHLVNKELDYASSAYYIVCAENGEDIIYWSKLYGIFPTVIPDSVMSWDKAQIITNPQLNITYQYSFKRDWNSSIIAEFNLNSSGEYKYLETYDSNILSTGNTWVGAPFIEMVRDDAGRTIYKLRFRKS